MFFCNYLSFRLRKRLDLMLFEHLTVTRPRTTIVASLLYHSNHRAHFKVVELKVMTVFLRYHYSDINISKAFDVQNRLPKTVNTKNVVVIIVICVTYCDHVRCCQQAENVFFWKTMIG